MVSASAGTRPNYHQGRGSRKACLEELRQGGTALVFANEGVPSTVFVAKSIIPKNRDGQVQLPSRAHARAAFAALTIGSINHPLRSMTLSPRCRTPVAMQIVEHMSADSHRALLLVVWCAISGLCAVRGSWGCS